MCLGLSLVLLWWQLCSLPSCALISLFSLWRALSWVRKRPVDLCCLVKDHYAWVSPLSDQREGGTNTARKQAARWTETKQNAIRRPLRSLCLQLAPPQANWRVKDMVFLSCLSKCLLCTWCSPILLITVCWWLSGCTKTALIRRNVQLHSKSAPILLSLLASNQSLLYFYQLQCICQGNAVEAFFPFLSNFRAFFVHLCAHGFKEQMPCRSRGTPLFTSRLNICLSAIELENIDLNVEPVCAGFIETKSSFWARTCLLLEKNHWDQESFVCLAWFLFYF